MGSSAAQPLLPFYMECIHSPKFQAGSTGDLCQVLGRPSVDNHTLSWAEYKLLDTLEMDPSRCEAFVQAIAPEFKAQAQLQHVSVKLRPQSSDHSVLLQVRTTSEWCARWNVSNHCLDDLQATTAAP